jgi:hypothetical protein
MAMTPRFSRWWAVPAGLAVLAGAVGVAVPALAGTAHREQAKKPTLAS